MAWWSWRSWLIGVGLVVALSGCGGGTSGPPAPVPLPPAGDSAAAASIATSSYKLGSGDRIRLAVFRDETLSGEFTLDGAGNFSEATQRFVVDSTGSIASGNASNAFFNALVLLIAVGPLWKPAKAA